MTGSCFGAVPFLETGAKAFGGTVIFFDLSELISLALTGFAGAGLAGAGFAGTDLTVLFAGADFVVFDFTSAVLDGIFGAAIFLAGDFESTVFVAGAAFDGWLGLALFAADFASGFGSGFGSGFTSAFADVLTTLFFDVLESTVLDFLAASFWAASLGVKVLMFELTAAILLGLEAVRGVESCLDDVFVAGFDVGVAAAAAACFSAFALALVASRC